MGEIYDPKPQRQTCLKCGETLFITSLLGSDTEARGIDRTLDEGRDEEGSFVRCKACGAKHNVLEWTGRPGEGGKWTIAGLRPK